MRDEAQMLSIRARIEAIVAEIEAAKLDNQIRMNRGLDLLNYEPHWFQDKAQELESIAAEVYR